MLMFIHTYKQQLDDAQWKQKYNAAPVWAQRVIARLSKIIVNIFVVRTHPEPSCKLDMLPKIAPPLCRDTENKNW